MPPLPPAPSQLPSGHVFRVERKRGPVWYAKYRLPDGRQVQKRIGPVWTERGRPPAGYFTKKTAEARLHDLLGEARRGTLPGMVVTGATFADAAAEWLRYLEHDRGRKPSTLAGYRAIVRSQLLPVWAELPIESMTTPMVEGWIAGVPALRAAGGGRGAGGEGVRGGDGGGVVQQRRSVSCRATRASLSACAAASTGWSR